MGAWAEARRRLNVFERKWLIYIAGVTVKDRINNVVVRFRTGKEKMSEDRVDSRVMRWF